MCITAIVAICQEIRQGNSSLCVYFREAISTTIFYRQQKNASNLAVNGGIMKRILSKLCLCHYDKIHVVLGHNQHSEQRFPWFAFESNCNFAEPYMYI